VEYELGNMKVVMPCLTHYNSICLVGTRETKNPSVIISGIWTENRNQDHMNMKQE